MNNNGTNSESTITYLLVWSGLVVLTALTVIVAGSDPGSYGSLISVLIASIKSLLILLFFMHMRREGFFIKTMFCITVMTIALIICLTFSDVWFRY
jgi:cytochrome c oxidase subunit 4